MQGVSMVKKTMYQKIQNLKKQGYGKYEISIQLGIDPATARKYFHMEPAEYNSYRDALQERNKLYEGYEQEILELYEKNNHRCLNMAAVYDYLEERHKKLAGNEKTLRNYIHSLLASGKLKYSQNIRCYSKVPELPYGKQMQLDFGVHQKDGGLKIHIFGAVLSASRYKYVGFQGKSFTTEDLILHLLDCFDNFGGLPEELVIDQDSIMVVNENYGDIVYTQKFSAFLEEMNLKMYVCRKSDPETKGKIENVIKYVKYNFLNVRNFQTMEEARESLARWLKRRGNGKISQATKKVPLLAVEEEREYLKPLRNSIFRKTALLGREVESVTHYDPSRQ
jgi:transposase